MMEPIKLYFSYNQIHDSIRTCVQDKKLFKDFTPTLIISIGGGGFIPARILRTFLKLENGKSIPIQAIGLTLYEHDDKCDPLDRPVRKTQWLTYQHVHGAHQEAAVSLQGHTILIVDEVDDTRKTLAYAVDELMKDIQEEKAAWLAAQQQQLQQRRGSTGIPVPTTPSMLSPPESPTRAGGMAAEDDGEPAAAAAATPSSSSIADAAAAAAAEEWTEPRVGVFVVHNKLKPKKADLPEWLMQGSYFSAGDIEDHWVIYPWDAPEIWEHTEKAHSPDSATARMVRSPSAGSDNAASPAASPDMQQGASGATPMVC